MNQNPFFMKKIFLERETNYILRVNNNIYARKATEKFNLFTNIPPCLVTYTGISFKCILWRQPLADIMQKMKATSS